MPEIQNGQAEDVLTLAEAAAYLRVSEVELLRLAKVDDIPAQEIGGEWRFLRKALADWLRYGREYYRAFRRSSAPWRVDPAVLEEMLLLVEKRLLDKLGTEQPARGSKWAVLKHAGVFQDDADMDEVLADMLARRKAAGG